MMRLDKLGGEQGDGGGFTKESGLLRWRTADARGARPAIACRELRRCDASFRLRSARLPRAPAVAPLRQRRRALAMANSSVRRRPSRSLEMKGTEGGFSQMLGALAGGRSRWAKARALPSARLTASQRGLAMSFRNDFASAFCALITARALLERLPWRCSLPAAPLFGCGPGLARLGSYLSRGASPHPAALSVNSPAEKTNPSVEATFSMENSLRD